MTNLEKYLDKIVKCMNTDDDFYCIATNYMEEDYCLGRMCGIHCKEAVVNWLLKDVQEYILKPSELEVLESIKKLRNDPDSLLEEISLVMELKRKGWFKGIPAFFDTKLTEVLDNCQIVSEDYNDFEESK